MKFWKRARSCARFVLASLAIASTPCCAETLRLSTREIPSSLDPLHGTTTSNVTIQVNLFEGLTTYDALGRIQPALAKSWVVSEGGRVYTFRLRHDGRWSDGRRVTSGDFVVAYRRFFETSLDLDSSGIYLATYLLKGFKNASAITTKSLPVNALGVRALDDFTLRIELEGATPYLPALLASPAMSPIPRHRLEKYGESWAEPKNIVGNGPYVWGGLDHRGDLILESNPEFRNVAELSFSSVRFVPMSSQREVLEAFFAGELDIAQNFRMDRLKWLTGEMGDRLAATSGAATFYFTLNTSRSPFSDVRVRRALSMALNREAIVSRLSVGGTPAHSFAPKSTAAGWDPLPSPWAGQPMAERLQAARALLKEAGFGPHRRIRLSVLGNRSFPNARVITAARSMWREIWVDVEEIRRTNAEDQAKTIVRGNFDLHFSYWFADFDDPLSFLSFVHPSSQFNSSRWTSSRFESHFRDLQRAMTPQSRWEHFIALEEEILREVPLIPVQHGRFYVLRADHIALPGLRFDGLIAAQNVRLRVGDSEFPRRPEVPSGATP